MRAHDSAIAGTTVADAEAGAGRTAPEEAARSITEPSAPPASAPEPAAPTGPSAAGPSAAAPSPPGGAPAAGQAKAPALTRRTARKGVVLAALGVACFSLTFPSTAWSLEGFGPWSATALRMAAAGVLAAVVLLALRVPVPARRHWAGLAVAASGVVIGFPLLTTLALQTSSTSHAAVVVGLLPLSTAVYSSLRGGPRPSPVFWCAALAGAAVVVSFALYQSGGRPTVGDLFLCAALLVCAAGYAEGGRLARELPALQVIGWALVGCLPVAAVGCVLALSYEPAQLTAHAVTGLLWSAAGSQFLGLLFWYRAMGLAGVARTSQVQLAQPLLTLVWAVLLLGEVLSPAAPAAAVGVLVCIAVVQRTRA